MKNLLISVLFVTSCAAKKDVSANQPIDVMHPAKQFLRLEPDGNGVCFELHLWGTAGKIYFVDQGPDILMINNGHVSTITESMYATDLPDGEMAIGQGSGSCKLEVTNATITQIVYL